MRYVLTAWTSQVTLLVKDPAASAGDARDAGLIPRPGRSPGEGNGNSLQYSCLKNSMDRGVHEAARSQTQLSDRAHTQLVSYSKQHAEISGKSGLRFMSFSKPSALNAPAKNAHIVLKELTFTAWGQLMLFWGTTVIHLFFSQQEIPGEGVVASKKARGDVEGKSKHFWLLRFNLSPTEMKAAFYLWVEKRWFRRETRWHAEADADAQAVNWIQCMTYVNFKTEINFTNVMASEE